MQHMKIWCPNQFVDISKYNRKFLQRLISRPYLPASEFRVAIIGGGPKGAYAIERIASVWNAHFPEKNLDIVVFNESPDFGSGPNYQPDQPDFLLMNYPLGKVNFWTEEEEQLVDERPSLLDFLSSNRKENLEEIQADDYCTRALTGMYLQNCLCRVLKALPDTIHVCLIKEKVNAIEEKGNFVRVLSDGGRYKGFSEVLCCTGHSYHASDLNQYQTTPDQIFDVYPARKWKDEAVADKTLLIKGLGLTFIDAVLALTEGKGGTFTRQEGRLHYHPSGNEPKGIYGYSRSGLPMIARQQDPISIPLRYFSAGSIDHLLQSAEKINFEKSVLPLIEKEFRYRYARLFCRYSGKQYFPTLSLDKLEERLANMYPAFSPLNFEEYLFPTVRKGEEHQQVMDHLETMVFPNAVRATQRAELSLSSLWREIYPHFSKLYAFGRFTGKSQELFDTKFRRGLQRISYGPPKINIEKLYALVVAGIVRFDIAAEPFITFSVPNGKFMAKDQSGKLEINADLMIDARVPAPGSMSKQPEYIQKLKENVETSFFSNEGYLTGCLEMDKNGRLFSQPKVAFYGIPTEGCTLDNESLSRDNNNLLSSWARQLIKSYAQFKHSKADAHCTSLD
jgi:hypothetical protein